MQMFNTNKAGMAGVDRERVERVIAENTSANYSSFSARQQQRVDRRVSEIKALLARVTPNEWSNAEKEMDQLAARLEASRDLGRHCVHVDMDAYFAAVEMRDDPALRDIPMAVGSSAMLGTSNYAARRFGVRAAMPGFIAMKLCPELTIVPGDYAKYTKESRIFSSIFADYDPDMGMGSLDEAYIDITEFVNARTEPTVLERVRYGGGCICRLPLIGDKNITEDLVTLSEQCPRCEKERISYKDSVEFGISRDEVVREMRFRVEQKTGLTCSAGIAANFMLAKVCSDLNKPNGQYELPNRYDDIMGFVENLSIRKIAGIGRVTEAHLSSCEVKTVGDLLKRRACLKFAFSQLQQESLLRTALGLSGRPRDGDPNRKSVSVERTFSPTSNDAELRDTVRGLCEQLAEDVSKMGLVGGRCLTLKIKLASFDVLTRSATLPKHVLLFEDLLSSATSILERELGQSIRLLGVRLSQLRFEGEEKTHKTVFDFWNSAKKRKLEEAGDDDDIILEDAPAGLSGQPTEEELLPSTSREEPPDVTSNADSVSCPICSKSLPNDDRMVNSHVDECLNSELIRDVAPRASSAAPPTKPPKRPAKEAITNYFQPK